MMQVRIVLCGLLVVAAMVQAYPLDGFETTGIRRLEAARVIQSGLLPGRAQPDGALLDTPRVDLRLLRHQALRLPENDTAFTEQILTFLGPYADRYSFAVLDLSDPDHPRYAEHRGRHKHNAGSVAKIAVALAIFQALADNYPDRVDERERILRDTTIVADAFIYSDDHKVQFYTPDIQELERRPIQEGDQGNLWEWLDWTLSASSNASAAMLQKHAMLLVHFGKEYPVSQARSDALFNDLTEEELSDLFVRTFFDPITRNNLDLESFRQGSFFTRAGRERVPGTSSYATSRELLRFFLAMEKGQLVDAYSSRSIKRLLYVTERRIRYAASPALRDAAVYLKSGSLYTCEPEEGFTCRKYQGNVLNLMNSAVIVESPAGESRYHYLVMLQSNVLKRNSAVDHQTLATRIHALIVTKNSDR